MASVAHVQAYGTRQTKSQLVKTPGVPSPIRASIFVWARSLQRGLAVLCCASLLVAAEPAKWSVQQSPEIPATKAPEAVEQEAQLPNRKISQLTTPDGSRFILIKDPNLTHIHWAIASWADGRDDPRGLPGLSLAAAQASLGGTWTSGSLNPQAEREALTKLDQAWQKQVAKPGDAKLAAEIARLDQVAAKLGDQRLFGRALAAAPAFQPEVLVRNSMAIFALTTIEPAMESVAKLILERREEQALRGLRSAWLKTALDRQQTNTANPRRRLYAELLALVMPTSPIIAQIQVPEMLAPTRDQAMNAWRSSQQPKRTVHVIFGSFELAGMRSTLKRVFATTKLASDSSQQRATPQPLSSERRSIVTGVPGGGGVIAWMLPANTDRQVLELVRRWLNSEKNPAYLALRQKRPDLSVTCYVPWPQATDGQSLLMLDIRDASDTPGVLDEVLAACQASTATPFRDYQFYDYHLSFLRDWNNLSDNPREIATMLAERSLTWPSANINPHAPNYRKGSEIHQTLEAVFASQPAIVEAK